MTDIKFRVRGPGGVETVTASADWTIGRLVQHIKDQQKLEPAQLKYGWPLRSIDLVDETALISALNLRGETLTVVPKDRSSVAASVTAASTMAPKKEVFVPKRVEADETTLEWPEENGFMALRVMPDDNSCMFTAFGGVIPIPDPAPILRKKVADYILAHPARFDKVVLEMEPQKYVRLIQSESRWGGAIELSILSDIYNFEICSIDVKSLRVDRYGEGKATRCLILYSGIHYDRIAFTYDLGLPVEVDVTKWSTDNDQVVEMARRLAAKLQKAHYYTDTNDFVLKCDICDWIGAGERQAEKHMRETGHSALSEMEVT